MPNDLTREEVEAALSQRHTKAGTTCPCVSCTLDRALLAAWDERDQARSRVSELEKALTKQAFLLQSYMDERDDALAKVKAIRELAVYGFTEETLANLSEPLSARDMNHWWMRRLDVLLGEPDAAS